MTEQAGVAHDIDAGDLSLSLHEVARLDVCEQSIRQGLAVFVSVGRALTEIRDSRLYRSTHRSFEAYCKERWNIGRSRAYDLIDQARVGDALMDAGVTLSRTATDDEDEAVVLSRTATDGVVLSRDDARLIKDSPAAIASIKSRVAAGEQPGAAIRAVAGERKALAERERAEAAAGFSPAVQAHRERVAGYRAAAHGAEAEPSGEIDALRARIEEQAEYIAALEAEVDEMKRQVARYDDMVVAYERGGFEQVVADRDEQIRVLEARFYSTNADMISWKKKAGWEIREKLRYKREAEKRGYSDDIDMDSIDPETGAVVLSRTATRGGAGVTLSRTATRSGNDGAVLSRTATSGEAGGVFLSRTATDEAFLSRTATSGGMSSIAPAAGEVFT